MKKFRVAPLVSKLSDAISSAGNPIYIEANLEWSTPTVWDKSMKTPIFETDEPFLYALMRNHGMSKTKDHIEYIGLTTNPKLRFANHSTAKKIVNQRGTVKFSFAPINFIRGRDKSKRTKAALNEIEHILIWAVNDHLHNYNKQLTLPGLGKNGGRAWHIYNSGHRFSGQMPMEIVYPWMIIKLGRNRTKKT